MSHIVRGDGARATAVEDTGVMYCYNDLNTCFHVIQITAFNKALQVLQQWL